MPPTTEDWKAFNDRLLFFTLRTAIWPGLVSPAWFAQLVAGANEFRISRIADTNVAVRDVTEDQVAAASTFSSATLEGQDVTRGIFEGTAQTRMLEVFETRVGSAMVQSVMEDLRVKMANHLDSKVSGKVAGATYGTATGNGLDLGKIGATGANGVGISISYKGIVGRGTSDTETAESHFVAQIADLALRMQEYWQDQNLRGVIVGDGAPMRFAMVTRSAVAAAIKRSEFAHANGFRSPSDVGAQLLTTLNLMGGMGAFEGMLHDTAIYSDNSLPKPTAADQNWPVYFVPVGSAVAMNTHIWRTDRMAGPQPEGEMVDRWISHQRYAVEVLKQAHLGRAHINASA